MSEKRWVQHKSGQGEKWEVREDERDFPHLWNCRDHQDNIGDLWLPKSEYVICDPPEQWEDVTDACHQTGLILFWSQGVLDHPIYDDSGFIKKDFRFIKIDGMHNGPAFIVERKRS